ncbi:MAG: DUF503 domain-containing protein [Myxococcota bacterium]
MVVGMCQVVLSLPGNNSLKGKRKVIRSIVDRGRSRFNAAVAEVDALDEHRKAVLGFSVVSNDHSHANAMIDQISSFIATAGDALMVGRSFELVHFDGSSDNRGWSES